MEELTEAGEFFVMKWPPQSLDLNPFENLWSILDKKLKDRVVYDEDQLFKVAQSAWKDLKVTSDVLENLVSSMPRRIEGCIKNKGLQSSY